MTKYYIIEALFNKTRWERIGERHDLMHKAVEEMERIDLTFPTRISKITKEVVLSEVIDGKRKKNPERKIRRKKKIMNNVEIKIDTLEHKLEITRKNDRKTENFKIDVSDRSFGELEQLLIELINVVYGATSIDLKVDEIIIERW